MSTLPSWVADAIEECAETIKSCSVDCIDQSYRPTEKEADAMMQASYHLKTLVKLLRVADMSDPAIIKLFSDPIFDGKF